MYYDMSGFDYGILDVVQVLHLRKRRGNYYDCPFCGETHGKLNINVEKNVFRCNRCDASGGMLKLYADLHNVTLSEANQQIREALGKGEYRTDYIKATPVQEEKATAELAPIEEIHRTYQRMLSMLTLNRKHQEDLQRRGLKPEQIEAQRYRSVPLFGMKKLVKRLAEEGYMVKGVPGFYRDTDGNWTINFKAENSGILIPIVSLDGFIQGFQIRVDHVTDTKKYIWLSSVNYDQGVSSGSPVHVIGDLAAERVYLTEGALKGTIAHYLSGATFVCVAGVNQYRNLKYQIQRSEIIMIKKLRVAVDHGNRNMKTCHFIFTTGLTEQDKKPARGEKYLKYQGKYYTLSEKRIPYQRDKTQDSRNRFWILTLFAIAMELEQKSQIQPEDVIQVELPIGLPPKHFAELCERYERYFKGDGKVQELCFNDKVYHLCIQNVMAFPQDYAAMMTRMMEIREIPKVVGIDIGGFTSDYLLMRSGRPDMDYCDSLEKGVITMYNDIISSINSEYDMLLEEADIDSIIKGKTQYYEEAVVQAVETMVQNFVTDLLNSIRERGIDTKSTYTVFIGGGAVLLERFLEQADRLGKHTFIRDMKANADGYDLLYRMTQAGV